MISHSICDTGSDELRAVIKKSDIINQFSEINCNFYTDNIRT